MEQANEWLRFAPPPEPLREGQKWHVFLSYRSTDRKWAVALYDILTQLKYQVFMDQYVLPAGAGLATSLGENLAASQAGVLAWSPRNEDSAWCRGEYDAFEALRAAGGFFFVPVRLHDAQLPAYVQGRLRVDATDQRDGPRGTSLLSILYGLRGKPLPHEALQLAARIDETTAEDLASIRSYMRGTDAKAILQLAENRTDDLAWQSSPVLSCAAAQALISVGWAPDALSLLERVRADFPAAIRPRQLTGLALARSGKWRQAQVVLGKLYELGERDPETIGILARTWMDAYDAERERPMLQHSRDLYAEGFELAPREYFLGINAAAKSIFLDEVDAGIEYAKAVEKIVGTKPKPADYWHSATVAEVQLIQRQFDLAAKLYKQAVAMAPGAVDDHRSTCKQARRLLRHLQATPEQGALVLGAFRREVDADDAQRAIKGIRGQGRSRVLTFAGFSGKGYEDVEEVRSVILDELEKFDPDDTLVCAGGTSAGIGMVYPLALQKGFRTAGIVSSLARNERASFSTECEIVFIVEDKTWGGRQANGRLSPTSQAMVGACDVMVGIGGGAIARDELEEARAKGKTVHFHRAEFNRALAAEKAAKAGAEPPSDFAGEAQSLFAES